MARLSKLAETVFGSVTKPVVPAWKQIQEEEAARRQEIQGRQKAARLAQKAAETSTAEPSAKDAGDGIATGKPSRPRKKS